MELTDADLRNYLLESFSLVEFDALCFDHFPRFYRGYTTDLMPLNMKVMELIDYCRRQGLRAKLIDVITNPQPIQYQYPIAQSKPLSSDAEPSKVKLSESAVDSIEIRILLKRSGERHIIEIPFDGYVREWLPQIVERLGLPVRFEDRSYVYRDMVSQSRGVILQPGKTFRENEVEDGEIFSFEYSGGDE